MKKSIGLLVLFFQCGLMQSSEVTKRSAPNNGSEIGGDRKRRRIDASNYEIIMHDDFVNHFKEISEIVKTYGISAKFPFLLEEYRSVSVNEVEEKYPDAFIDKDKFDVFGLNDAIARYREKYSIVEGDEMQLSGDGDSSAAAPAAASAAASAAAPAAAAREQAKIYYDDLKDFHFKKTLKRYGINIDAIRTYTEAFGSISIEDIQASSQKYIEKEKQFDATTVAAVIAHHRRFHPIVEGDKMQLSAAAPAAALAAASAAASAAAAREQAKIYYNDLKDFDFKKILKRYDINIDAIRTYTEAFGSISIEDIQTPNVFGLAAAIAHYRRFHPIVEGDEMQLSGDGDSFTAAAPAAAPVAASAAASAAAPAAASAAAPVAASAAAPVAASAAAPAAAAREQAKNYDQDFIEGDEMQLSGDDEDGDDYFNYDSSDSESSIEHVAEVEGNKPEWEYQCNVCKKKCENEEKLKIHLNSHMQIGGSGYSCNTCSMKFTNSSDLNKHKYYDHNQGAKCEKCEKIYIVIKKHICSPKPKSKLFYKYCTGQSVGRSFLNKHLSDGCSTCEKNYPKGIMTKRTMTRRTPAVRLKAAQQLKEIRENK